MRNRKIRVFLSVTSQGLQFRCRAWCLHRKVH